MSCRSASCSTRCGAWTSRATRTSSRSTSDTSGASWTSRTARRPSRRCAAPATGSSTMRERRIGSVRVRITLAVTLLFGLTLSVASVLFMQHVQRALVDDVHLNDGRALEELRALYESGSPPASVLPVSGNRPAMQVQVMLDNGDIVAATPGAPTQALDPRPPSRPRPFPNGGPP